MTLFVRRFASFLLPLVLLAAAASPIALAQEATPQAAPVPPITLDSTDGVFFGVDLDWGNDSLANYSTRLGATPAISYIFLPYPLDANAISTFDRVTELMGSVGGAVMVALQPATTLDALTETDALTFAEHAGRAEAAGVPLMVDFAAQMNGSWFAYGLKPTQFVPAYRGFVDTVRAAAPQTRFVWSPAYAEGYPFVTREFLPDPESEDFGLLDTDGDGEITMSDDPYAPFYPGDEYVDWVGMTLNHWGNTWPWHENERPEEGTFLDQIHGDYNGRNGDATALPDFYVDYVETRGKPFVLRTAALYLPNEPGDNELTIKQAWWRQVLSAETLAALPGMRAVIWEEWVRPEFETNNSIADWRITASRTVRRAFVADIPMNELIFAPGRLTGGGS
ncbi:MAG: hypothetical protein IT336_04020 [Thermomicrobiales bacterium]|nr:hypothetical protein [Thermomicrobiales bacterium]